jgi:hypothetical protein
VTMSTLTYVCPICDHAERHRYDHRWPIRRCTIREHGPMTIIDVGGAATDEDDRVLRIAAACLLALVAGFVLALAVIG